jgi:hypothetical protein
MERHNIGDRIPLLSLTRVIDARFSMHFWQLKGKRITHYLMKIREIRILGRASRKA